jgi:hypothetical protein
LGCEGKGVVAADALRAGSARNRRRQEQQING